MIQYPNYVPIQSRCYLAPIESFKVGDNDPTSAGIAVRAETPFPAAVGQTVGCLSANRRITMNQTRSCGCDMYSYRQMFGRQSCE